LVEHPDSLRWFADVVSPLASQFGDRLTLVRDGNRVQWTVDGQAAVMELGAGSEIAASFVDRPSVDLAGGRPAAAVYRGRRTSYGLDPDGCSVVVSDMLDFFSGTREPAFTFVDAVFLDA
jgi:hypothetical protein